ncbi:MAG TPA: hypothetical protein VJJ76_01340 [archaeon]|nr:hypothetical protein [archaeon]
MKFASKLFFASVLFALAVPSISLAQEITINCDPCYVNNCQCIVNNCNNGKLYVYKGSCQTTASYTLTITSRHVEFFSIQPDSFYARVSCDDDGQISSCLSFYVGSYPDDVSTPTSTSTSAGTSTPTATTTMSATSSTTSTNPNPTQTQIRTSTATTTRRSGTNATSSLFSVNNLLIIAIVAVVAMIFVMILLYYKNRANNY